MTWRCSTLAPVCSGTGEVQVSFAHIRGKGALRPLSRTKRGFHAQPPSTAAEKAKPLHHASPRCCHRSLQHRGHSPFPAASEASPAALPRGARSPGAVGGRSRLSEGQPLDMTPPSASPGGSPAKRALEERNRMKKR